MARLSVSKPSFMKQSLADLKNPAFYKILVFFVIAMIVPVTAIAFFSIRHSSESIVTQVTQSSVNSLSDKSNILELRFNEFEKLCFQIFNNNDLNRARIAPTKSYTQQTHARNFINYLENHRKNNDLIDSVYVYDIGNNYVLSDAKHAVESFEDIEVIKIGMEQELSITHRQLNGRDVISTDLNETAAYKILEDIKLDLNSRNVKMTMTIGKSYEDINDTYVWHQKNLLLMDNKFFFGTDKVIVSTDSDEPPKKNIYDKNLEEKIISCISNQNSSDAIQALNLLIEKITINNVSAVYIRFVYYQIIHNILESLDGTGINISEISTSSAEILEHIQNTGTLRELEEYACNIISKCTTLMGKYREMQHDIIADKATEFIKANYHKNIGVEEVARVVYLSPGHLNIIFKAVKGWSVYEYITRLRMEAAIKLLRENNQKVKEIAVRVGYNNVQCFLRLFKKYYNMTPVEYRRTL